jgi:hypothetical protein
LPVDPPSSTARVCSRSTLRALARQGSSCCLLLTGRGRRIRPWHCCRVARMQRDFSRSMLQGPHTWPAASTQHAYRSSQMRSTVIFVIALLAATESALGFTLSTGPIAVPALDHSRRIPAQQRPLSVRAKEAGPALRMAGGVTEVPLAVKAAKTGTLVYGILIGAGGISAGA